MHGNTASASVVDFVLPILPAIPACHSDRRRLATEERETIFGDRNLTASYLVQGRKRGIYMGIANADLGAFVIEGRAHKHVGSQLAKAKIPLPVRLPSAKSYHTYIPHLDMIPNKLQRMFEREPDRLKTSLHLANGSHPCVDGDKSQRTG
jgi:hypothetical protein